MNSSQVNNNSWNVPIDKLMIWRNNWAKYDRKNSNLHLRVIYDQLLITDDTKILESFNMHQKLKGIYKEDVLILIASAKNCEIRKLKFQIKANLQQCFETLSQHFPMVNHSVAQTNKVINSKYRNISDVLKYAVENKGNTASVPIESQLPKEFENFIRLCLLDPAFPLLITETEAILKAL